MNNDELGGGTNISDVPVNSGSVDKKRRIRIVSIVVAVLVIIVLLIIIIIKSKSSNNSLQSSDNPEVSKIFNSTTGEVWFSSPKTIVPAGWLKTEFGSYYNDDEYYSVAQQLKDNMPTYKEVGKRNGNTIVLVFDPGVGQGASNLFLFEKRDDKVVAIGQPQDGGVNVIDIIKGLATDKVTVFDTETRFDSLSVPPNLVFSESGESVYRPPIFYLGEKFDSKDSVNGVKETVVDKFGQSSLIKSETTYADTGLTNIAYFLETPIKTRITMRYEPNELSLDGYSFNDNVSMKSNNGSGVGGYDSLLPVAQGCGTVIASATRVDNLSDDQLRQIGQTGQGNAVYELINRQADLYQKAYKEYKDSYDSSAVIAFDEYINNHGLMIIKNKQGEKLVYVRGSYAPTYGCAKPVIYLYPEVKTKVSVVVGADVTISDPLYPVNGWRDVLAYPNGSLVYQGAKYDSLFWEGNGHGRYPAITSGTVVKQSDALATIQNQLVKLGLNTKEISDFMDFWGDKIPDSPYIRLTWFNTDELNRLAPLKITPKPDTLIRVFLDMSGLERPISIQSQELVSTPRRGFTVVEWGGLTTQKLK